MSTSFTRSIFALVVALCATVAQALSPGAISGSYYDPNHSGHGFSIEALDGERAIAWWYVYDRDGNPVHLYIEGDLRPRADSTVLTLTGRAYLPRGMRFGTFSPSDLTLAQWGDVVLNISCVGATGTYDANGPAGAGFGKGTLFLTRLSAIKGINRPEDCVLELPGRYTPAAYRGTYTEEARSVTAPMFGALDESGRLWLMGPDTDAPTITALALHESLFDDKVASEVRASVAFFGGLPRSANVLLAMPILADGNTRVRIPGVHSKVLARDGQSAGAPKLISAVDVDADLADTAALHRRFDLGAIAGRRFVNPQTTSTLTVDTRGVLCLVRYPIVSTNCALSGKLTPVPGEWAFFDFELAYAEGDAHAVIKGRGWVLSDAEGKAQRIVMVGAQGGDGLGFYGELAER